MQGYIHIHITLFIYILQTPVNALFIADIYCLLMQFRNL